MKDATNMVMPVTNNFLFIFDFGGDIGLSTPQARSCKGILARFERDRWGTRVVVPIRQVQHHKKVGVYNIY